MPALEQHKQRLRNAGYKLTHARSVVLQAIDDLGGHITSSDVLDRVGELDESIGRASVFRTLDVLTQIGIIRPTYIDTSQTPTYVMLPGGHHHHVICTNCNRVIEFSECDLSGLERRLEEQFGVSIDGHLLEFYGVCEGCQNT